RQLYRCVAFGQQLIVSVEISLLVCKLGLIAIAGAHHLVELSLIGSRVDFGERVAGFYGLSLGEGNLCDLTLNLAANDDGVIGDDRSDPAQIDWHIATGNGAGDDRYGRGCWRRRACRISRAPFG